jgi:Kef-type K+ transport system membrane component KefB
LLLTTVAALAVFGIEHSGRLGGILQRLQDTTAQIRVRGAFLLLMAFVVLAQALGLEVILGAFAAGALLRFVDRDRTMTHPLFRQKLEAVGFGVFIPIFFVTSGIQFNLRALFSNLSAIVLVPLFLLALLIVRGLPALLYRQQLGSRSTLIAGLLQATSLPFIVAATQIGMELGLLSQTTGAALVAAGLLSVLLFPLSAVLLLRSGKPTPAVLLEQSAAERM